MLSASCHCGAVHISLPRQPDWINQCNCSLCASPPAVAEKVATGFSSATASTEYPVWWGYYAPAEVDVTGSTSAYARADKPDPVVKIHFCGNCGCTTHFRTMEGFAERTGVDDVMGVNMRLFAAADLAGVELRYPDGAAWDGIGQWGFVREAVVL